MSLSNIENLFTCNECQYSEIVSGIEYFDIESMHCIGTRRCMDCNRLFDNIVTYKVSLDTIKAQSSENKRIELCEKNGDINSIYEYGKFLSTVKGKKRKRVKCRWCASTNNEIWGEEKPICPRCNNQMIKSDNVISKTFQADDFSNLDSILKKSSKVILCYIEPTCSLCRHAQYIIKEIDFEYHNEFLFVEFDWKYAEENNLTSEYKMKNLPTFLTFKNGKYVGKFSNIESKIDFIGELQRKFK